MNTNKHTPASIREPLPKYFITQQANGAYSIYTDTGKPSIADEELIQWDVVSNEAAERIVTDTLRGEFTYEI